MRFTKCHLLCSLVSYFDQKNCKKMLQIKVYNSVMHSVVIILEQVFIENWDFLTITHDFLVSMDSH